MKRRIARAVYTLLDWAEYGAHEAMIRLSAAAAAVRDWGGLEFKPGAIGERGRWE